VAKPNLPIFKSHTDELLDLLTIKGLGHRHDDGLRDAVCCENSIGGIRSSLVTLHGLDEYIGDLSPLAALFHLHQLIGGVP
jgi:hypothetical protein